MKFNIQPVKVVTLIVVITFGLMSCTTDEYGNKREMTDTEKGLMIGTALGVLAGLTTKNKKKKSVLYGLVGGISGAAVGAYMDSQKKDFEKQLKDEIQRGDINLTKLPNESLMVTMTAQTSFNVNSSSIKPAFHSTMDKIAGIVKKYGKTHLILVGHTDSTGSHAYNQQLSEQRASSVNDYLLQSGVIKERLSVYGRGEDNPRADNATEHGRSLNRRVEIIIEPVVIQEQE